MRIFLSHCKQTPHETGCIFFDLESEGHTLYELLTNAVYYQIDQDGVELSEMPAHDHFAEVSIANAWLNFETKPANSSWPCKT